MEKWKLTFDVQWEENLPPKRQTIVVKEKNQYILQLTQALDACSTVTFIEAKRLEQ